MNSFASTRVNTHTLTNPCNPVSGQILGILKINGVLLEINLNVLPKFWTFVNQANMSLKSYYNQWI